MTAVASSIKRGYIDTPEGQLHCYTGGQGFPLVMLHQNPSSGAMWEAVMPGLAERGHKVVAFDTPGYGMSDRPREKTSIPYYARRFVEGADALGLEQFDVLGHHTGALVSAQIAANYPDRVRKVVLIGYPMLRGEMHDGLLRTGPVNYTVEGTELAGIMKGIQRLGNRWLTPHVARRCLIEKLQAGEEWFWAYHAVAATDFVDLAKRIKAPVLLLGGRADPITGPSDEAAGLMPNATVQFIEDGGVNVADDAPAEFVAAVDRFLNG